MKLRFLPMAWARRNRIPDGRLSRTSLKMRLYTATAPLSAGSSTAASAKTTSTAQPLDGLLDLRERRRIHGKLAQPAIQQGRDATRIARHVAAQADTHSGAAAVLRGSRDQLQNRRMQWIHQGGESSVRAIAGKDILRQVV